MQIIFLQNNKSIATQEGRNSNAPHTSKSDLAKEFSTFCIQKIQTICDYLDNPEGDGSPKIGWQDEPKFNTQLSEFKSFTEDEVKKIVLKTRINIVSDILFQPIC